MYQTMSKLLITVMFIIMLEMYFVLTGYIQHENIRNLYE